MRRFFKNEVIFLRYFIRTRQMGESGESFAQDHRGGKMKILPDRKLLNLGICPACGSATGARVTRTDRPRRKWACSVCAHQWETLEIIAFPDEITRAALSKLAAEGHISFGELLPLLHLTK